MKKRIFFIIIFIVLMILQNNLFAQCCTYSAQQQVEPPTSAATFGVALGDFDGDNDLDAVSISAYYGIDVYFNNGSGTFTLNAQYAVGTNTDFYGVHVVNVDGDADLDIIAIPFYTTSSLTVLKNNGAGVFTVSSLATNIATYNAAVGDIDNDNDIDVFLPNSGGGAGKVIKNNGSGVFSIFQSSVTGARGNDADLGDLDGDGDLDAFVSENSAYGNSVFKNNGTGTFTQFGTNFGTQGGTVALGDLDGDGDLDAWVGNYYNTSEIWLNNGNGVFTLGPVITNNPVWGYTKAVNLYDMDNDGDLDVILGFYSLEPQVWTNNGNLNFSLCYQATLASGSHGQAIGDMNGDGKIDIYSGYFSNTDGDYVFLNTSVTASILYKDEPYCFSNSTPQTVLQTGAGGGTYTAIPAGLNIDINTGTIVPSSSTPGTYTVTYTVSACPFTTTVVITSLDLTTSLNGATITANQSGAAYQWVDCNNSNLPIAGQTMQSFTPSSNGNYAAIINYNACSDTTACVNVTSVGIDETTSGNEIIIYPNPANDRITVQVNTELLGAVYSVVDGIGRIVLSGQIYSARSVLDIAELPAGVYMLRVGLQDQLSFKIIKK